MSCTVHRNIPPCKAGDSWTGLEIQLRDKNNNDQPIDLTGCSIEMDIVTHNKATTPAKTWSTTNGLITITDAVNGTFEVGDGIDKLNVEPNIYRYDIQVTFPDTTVITYLTGKWTIQADYA